MDAIDLDKDNWEINALFHLVMLQLISDFYLFVRIFAKIDNLFVWIFFFFWRFICLDNFDCRFLMCCVSK